MIFNLKFLYSPEYLGAGFHAANVIQQFIELLLRCVNNALRFGISAAAVRVDRRIGDRRQRFDDRVPAFIEPLIQSQIRSEKLEPSGLSPSRGQHRNGSHRFFMYLHFVPPDMSRNC